MKKIKNGFTLIETIFALGILGLIAGFLLPSLNTLIVSSNSLKNESEIIFAIQAAIENEKANDYPFYGTKIEKINDFDIRIDRHSYSESLDKITASYNSYKLEFIEENHEKKGIHSN